MQASDRKAFAALISDALAFYKQGTTPFSLSVWWEACQPFELEQVNKALVSHTMDPDHGRFAPMPADIVRVLQGTRVDRAAVAWGKVYDRIRRVGQYATVTFDDPAIHATVTDLGGWPALCQTKLDDLPFLQQRFQKTYMTFVGRECFVYPERLAGVHALENQAAGRGEPIAILQHGASPALLQTIRLITKEPA